MIFDSHTHIHFSAYNKDREEVVKRAQKAGVKMITVGINPEDSKRAIKMAEEYPNDIWATVGVHPNERKTDASEILQLASLAQNDKVVAIGECGLDYFRGSKNKEEQKKIFVEQIKLAQEIKKPLMIHCRPSERTDDAYEDLIDEIRTPSVHADTRCPQTDVIVHFFNGSLEITKQLLELGCYFTFGGVITFSRDYDEIIKLLPLDKIMVETDAPYVAPEPYRSLCREAGKRSGSKRNEPAYVVEVVKKLAEIKGVSFEEVVRQTTKNIREVFRISL